ncbi:beta-phosphoglucomutase family hydrolase (plasmid) [Rhodococcus pyridinivorans]|nr:beta-phosphoglucomutase family hydrolase [Rhodococcus pyridinivorans]
MRGGVAGSGHPVSGPDSALSKDHSAPVHAAPTLPAESDGRIRPEGHAHYPYAAVLFDMDGVLVDTADLHARAWKETFDETLRDPRVGAAQTPFDAAVEYRRYVDGRPRSDGVATFLAARGISLPPGAPDDPEDAWTVHAIGNRKNSRYHTLLAEQGVPVFPGTLALLQRLRLGGVATAVVTSSGNATTVLSAAALDTMFDVVVDGTVAAERDLPGKPDPAVFLHAARLLGVPPSRAVVVEDAGSGIEAARRGGFALVVGIDRGGNRRLLEAAGADLVLGDVSELDLGAVRTDPWQLIYRGFDPAHEGHREVLTALGNGYMGVRGAAPERRADGTHYPGTYLAGVYNRLTSSVHGRRVEDEHLVNTADWLWLDVRIETGPWWSEGGLIVEDERRVLDLRRALLIREVRLRDGQGRRLQVRQRRVVSMQRFHLAALETTLTPLGWSGTLTVRSGIDPTVTNSNVADYAALAHRHLTATTIRHVQPDVLLVQTYTSQSRIRIATAVRTRVRAGDVRGRDTDTTAGIPAHQFRLEVHHDHPVVVDKIAAIATSKDAAIASPGSSVLGELDRVPGGVTELLPGHEAAWRRLWDRFRVQLDTDRELQLVLNLHLFHLMQTVSPHSEGLDTGVPARGLNGEGYRGHVFWDELFVLPVITTHLPAVTRSLLEYRWRRLDTARDAAARAGLAGALFPWQSGSDGREETPTQLYNPRSERWMPDNSRRQRHVGLAVAYNAWQYYQSTGDRVWLTDRGGELLIEVARLFTSLAEHDPEEDRFHLSGVMGPDEYHDGYPEAPGLGVRDNAYTNVMAAWVCHHAAATVAELAGTDGDELLDRLGVDPEEMTRWRHLSRRIAVPFHDGLISQFDGYDRLSEFDWPRYRRTYGNIGRLDLILESEADTTNRYKLAKQADVLMLLYLLGPTELLSILARLGYDVTAEQLTRTVDYYLARTAHGSTLSRVVHASVLARIDPARAWGVFREALIADLDDTQGGTTREGIHLGAMAGTVDIVTRSFAGVRFESDRLVLTPQMPPEIRQLQFRLHYRGHRIDVRLDESTLYLTAHRCTATAVTVDVDGAHRTLGGGQTLQFPLQRHPTTRIRR